MVGGAGYMAGKAGQRSAAREEDQNERLQSPESDQQPAPEAAPAAAPAATAAPDMVGRLKELAELKASGALSQEEFDAAKAKVLAG
jgi:hypothetical protein